MVLSFALKEKFFMGCGASTDITSAVIAPNANVVNLDVPPTTPGNLCYL